MCVMVNGATVVDLAGGGVTKDDRAVAADTLVDFYSVGKAFLAVLALQLVDAGLIGLDDPVASVWPEFAAGGKEAATLRHALCHRAAVPAIPRAADQRRPLGLGSDDRRAGGDRGVVGTRHRHAYHTNTYGHLIGEVVRRVSGETCTRRLAGLAGPLGADVHVGGRPAHGTAVRR